MAGTELSTSKFWGIHVNHRGRIFSCSASLLWVSDPKSLHELVWVPEPPISGWVNRISPIFFVTGVMLATLVYYFYTRTNTHMHSTHAQHTCSTSLPVSIFFFQFFLPMPPLFLFLSLFLLFHPFTNLFPLYILLALYFHLSLFSSICLSFCPTPSVILYFPLSLSNIHSAPLLGGSHTSSPN